MLSRRLTVSKFRHLFAFLLLLCALTAGARDLHADDAAEAAYDPHHVDGSKLGGDLRLFGNWLVKGGDDPSFALPDYDDSRWQVSPSYHRLVDSGIRDQPIVWYRVHVQVPATSTDISLFMYGFQGSMEAYVNGVKVGGLGDMRDGGERRLNDRYYRMPIPPAVLNDGNLVIAVRGAIGKWTSGERYNGGMVSARIGLSGGLSDDVQLELFKNLSSNCLHLVLQVVLLLVLIAFLSALPAQTEYKFLIASFAFSCAQNAIGIASVLDVDFLPTVFMQFFTTATIQLASTLALLEFIRIVVGKSGRVWIRVIQGSITIASVLYCLWIYILYVERQPLHHTLAIAHNIVQALLWLPLIVILPILILRSWLAERKAFAAWLLFPVILLCGLHAYLQLGSVLYFLKLVSTYPSPNFPTKIISINWDEVVDAIVELTILVYIILRVVRTVREGARYASEVEAAQTVQKVLLARSREATPGFRVDTVYLPASEVGGDFFLVSPGADGSLVAIVGDVAGKGMLAAMRVSVILGILRREDSREPGTILSRLNDAMMLQGDMGLTTACCVRIERDGRYSVANAGHISPYIAGREVATAGALPLGIALDQEYVEFEGWLAKGEALVLMSDGVVEARSSSKELYGFERLSALTRLSAAEIANAAKLFGQEDDITVLSLVCVA